MSRSYKKTSIGGITTRDSEKNDKQIANRILRANVRVALAREDEVMPKIREVSNVWDFAKDGKYYFDAKKHPKRCRK